MVQKPVIGITLDLAQDSEKYSFAKRPWYALGQDYANCIEQAGGIPLMIPYIDDIASIIDKIDGLIIPGGDEDINPRFYGQAITSNKVKLNDKRAEFEMKLVQAAMEVDMPVFGICNGIQLINVILGGTLIQDIPTQAATDINHEQPEPKSAPSHLIYIKDNTILAGFGDKKELMVNSTHHQSIDQLGSNLIISAIAPDGIIEAIESTNYKFVIGVQWHSEYLNTELDVQLFKRLVEESSKTV